MHKLFPFYLVVVSAILLTCCNTHVTKSQDVNSGIAHSVGKNLMWLGDLEIYADSLIISDTIPDIFSRKGIYLDSLQIHELIADKIPNRAPLSISSIRIFSIKELSDSLLMCGYVYEFSDIEDIYMFLYKNSNITDVLKLPIQEESNISFVTDDIEYIDYVESFTEFTDNSHFIIIEKFSTKGWDIDGECVFKTTMSKKTHYTISADGKIHKENVVKSQSSIGRMEF